VRLVFLRAKTVSDHPLLRLPEVKHNGHGTETVDEENVADMPVCD